MCMPSVNEISESVFELSCTQVTTYGSGKKDVKLLCPQILSGDIIILEKGEC